MIGLGWGDFWAVVALTLFVVAILIWADYAGSIVEAARLQ